MFQRSSSQGFASFNMRQSQEEGRGREEEEEGRRRRRRSRKEEETEQEGGGNGAGRRRKRRRSFRLFCAIIYIILTNMNRLKVHLEHNIPQSWNKVNQQALNESPPPKFKQPRHVDPEGAPACPRQYQVRQARGGAQAVSPVPFFAAASRAP